MQEVIEREEREGRPVNREETPEERQHRMQFQHRMDIDDSDIIIQGANTTRLPRKQVSLFIYLFFFFETFGLLSVLSGIIQNRGKFFFS